MHNFEPSLYAQRFQCQVAGIALRATATVRDSVFLCKIDEVREGVHGDGGVDDEHLREARDNRNRYEVTLRIKWQLRVEHRMCQSALKIDPQSARNFDPTLPAGFAAEPAAVERSGTA